MTMRTGLVAHHRGTIDMRSHDGRIGVSVNAGARNMALLRFCIQLLIPA